MRSDLCQDSTLSKFITSNEYVLPTLNKDVFDHSVSQCFGPTSNWTDAEMRHGWNLLVKELAGVRGGLHPAHPDDVFADLDYTTSPGHPWNRLKMNKELVIKAGFTPSVLFRTMLEKLFTWSGNVCVFTFFFKDELLKAKKAALKRNRIICGGPLDHTIALGVYSKPLDDEIERSRHFTPFQIGINPFSTEWDALAKRHLRFKNHWFADFSGFEYLKHPGEDHYLAWFRASKLRDSRKAFDVLRRLYFNATYAVAVDPFGRYYQLYGGQRSGVFVTCSDNSLTQFRYWLSAFSALCPGRSFRNHVELSIFGDDCLLSVSDEVALLFNPTTIRDYFARHGAVVTGPSDFVPWQEVDFLSFRFVRHPWMDLWVPSPVRVSKLIMSMTVYKRGMSLSDRLLKCTQIRRMCCFNADAFELADRISWEFIKQHEHKMKTNVEWINARLQMLDLSTCQSAIDGLPIFEHRATPMLKNYEWLSI